jgi:hypothetical protein
MVEKIVISLTICKGMVTKSKSLKVLIDRTLVYVMIEAVSQTPKQAERGNIATFLDAISF